MDFNFDEITDRKNSHSIKWSSAENTLPMWIADMDFKTAPAIIEALQKRIDHGVFGYTETPLEFYNAIVNWWKKRYGFTVEKEWIVPVTGVIPALCATIKSLTDQGDKIILQSPGYNHFYTSISNCERVLVENKLTYHNGKYTIDFEDLARQVSDPEVKIMIVCNPHNPVGRVWNKDELQKIGDICLEHNVIVISDEIHSDLVFEKDPHIPFASLGEKYSNNTITLHSPSKTFNLAGLQVGYFFTQNTEFKNAIEQVFVSMGIELLNVFAIETLIAAYEKSEDWLEALKEYIRQNYLFLKDFAATHLPDLQVMPLEGTYLVWLDISVFRKSSDEIAAHLLKEQNLQINSGTMYGSAGEGFIRINIATPQSLLKSGLEKLKLGLSNLK